jgi:hypothetical protein
VRQSVSRMCCWVRAGSFQAFRGSSPITTSSPSRKHTRSQGPSLRRRYPASSVDPVRLPPCPPPHATLELRAPTETGLPRLLVPPAQRAELTTPTDRAGACVVRTAFPVIQAGRHPHLHFRGLLKLHSRFFKGCVYRGTHAGDARRKWCVREARELLAAGLGHCCHLGERVQFEVESVEVPFAIE